MEPHKKSQSWKIERERESCWILNETNMASTKLNKTRSDWIIVSLIIYWLFIACVFMEFNKFYSFQWTKQWIVFALMHAVFLIIKHTYWLLVIGYRLLVTGLSSSIPSTIIIRCFCICGWTGFGLAFVLQSNLIDIFSLSVFLFLCEKCVNVVESQPSTIGIFCVAINHFDYNSICAYKHEIPVKYLQSYSCRKRVNGSSLDYY